MGELVASRIFLLRWVVVVLEPKNFEVELVSMAVLEGQHIDEEARAEHDDGGEQQDE